MELQKLAALVEYDGTGFVGYQRQPGGRTVQGELEKAVGQLAGSETRVHGASRTDAGVHASGQVISFWMRSSLSPHVVVRALNHYLPEDVALKGACVIDRDFDVRRRAYARMYQYRIRLLRGRSPLCQRYCLVLSEALDVSLMRQAAAALQGSHDFASFATSLEAGESTVRVVHEARVVQRADDVEFCITANAFLRHQVRNTVGQLLRVGMQRCSVDEFVDLVRQPRSGVAGPAAPSRGLCLAQVRYEPSLPFAM